jgi:hypothetical protein
MLHLKGLRPRSGLAPAEAETAVRFPRNATDDEIWAVVRQWTNALADGDYERAVAMTAHSEGLTPEVMRRIIEHHLHHYPDHRVTSFDDAQIRPRHTMAVQNGNFPRQWIHRDDDGEPFSILYSVPFDGYRSDMTAKFDVVEVDDDLALYFVDAYVM